MVYIGCWMSIEYPQEVKMFREKLHFVYPKADSYALTVGSILCALAYNGSKGDALATTIINAIREAEDKWDEARDIFQKQYKYKFNERDDLIRFLDVVEEKNAKLLLKKNT